tara:strand:- start:798 stop:1325 length:528 start_codon:yes stop_codon:yes gene_type:complete
MATFKVDDLKSRLPGGGARANLFRATVEFPGYAGGDSNLVSFLCKGAQLPASVVGQVDVPFRGQVLKVAGDRTYENWTVTIINDDLFKGRDAFERWMNGINQNKTNQGLVSPQAYQADMIIEQLTRDDLVSKTVTVRGAFPINVSAIDLSYDTTDAIEEFTVEFAYQYWESNTTS